MFSVNSSSITIRQYLTNLDLPCPSLEAAEAMMTKSEVLEILGILTLATLTIVTVLTAVIIIRLQNKVKIFELTR